jgi:adenosylcobinamide-phosphate synthase
MAKTIYLIIPLVAGYLLDLLLGDPQPMPHPVRLFGWLIKKGERLLNRPAAAYGSAGVYGPTGAYGSPKVFFWGMAMTLLLCAATYLSCRGLLALLWTWSPPLYLFVSSIGVFYGLANRQLIVEGVKVFRVLQTGAVKAGSPRTAGDVTHVEAGRLEAARKQLSRIVGRDTSKLTPQQIRIAVLETMSENLGDGVIAPLFYFAIAGLPGMLTYKMINTLDSMIGYRNERYEQFGKFAARLDDVANFVPARLTALLMVAVAAGGKGGAGPRGTLRDARWSARRDMLRDARWSARRDTLRDARWSARRDALRGAAFIRRYGHRHKSPNAGYPEAALAGILDARFGGPNVYHGVLVDKPYIGTNNREIGPDEITRVSRLNNGVCLLMVLFIILFTYA